MSPSQPLTLNLSMPPFSATGQKLTARSGILQLMDDLGRAMTVEPDMLMLGGGNPAAVPAMQQVIRERMSELLADSNTFDISTTTSSMMG